MILILIWISVMIFYMFTVLSPNCLHIHSYKLLYNQMIKKKSILNLFYFRKNTILYPRLKLISISLFVSLCLALISIGLFVIGKVNHSLEKTMNYILLGNLVLIFLINGLVILYLNIKEWYINKTSTAEEENKYINLIEKEYPKFFSY